MKLTIILLIIGLAQVSAKSYGQLITLHEKNVSIEKVLLLIESQSAYHFIYDDKLDILKTKTLNINVDKQTIANVLDQCLNGIPVSYKIFKKTIALKETEQLQNQEIVIPVQKISGIVTDDKGAPLTGVSIMVQGTKNGTVSDANGKYNLTVPGQDAILVFSFIGFEAQQKRVGDNTVIDVILKPKESTLNDVVVTGYSSQKKANITGAVSTVNMNQVNEIPVANLSNALAGRAPGMNVTNTSGLAGATSSIRIRGSFGDPLYVIDGVIRDKNGFDELDPNEIDQLNVLKDAATASVYGTQAGNGVIVVTTKRGKVQKPVFDFQTSYTTARPTQTLLADLTTATDELTYQNRVAQFNAEQNNTPYVAPNGPAEFAYFKNRSYNVNDLIWRNPATQKNVLSVNGGSEKVTYYNLLSYTKEQGSYTNLDYGKFNLRSNVTANLSNAISLNINISGGQQNNDRFYWPFSGDDDYDVADFYRTTFNQPKTYPFYLTSDGTPVNYRTPYAVSPPLGSWNGWSVPEVVLGGNYIKTRRRQLNSIATLNIKLDQFVKGLSAKFVANYAATDYTRKWFLNFQNSYTFASADPNGNIYIPAPPDPSHDYVFTYGRAQPFLQSAISTGWNYQIDGYLNYDRKFGKHTISAMIVGEQSQSNVNNLTGSATVPLTSIDQFFAYSTDPQNRNAYGSEQPGAAASWIGKFNYNFDNRYLVDFSFREDGNSNFSAAKRWGFFPSVSLAWRISQESFFKNSVYWINDLKLRASYGTTGNVVDVNNNSIGPFNYITRYTNSGSYIYNNTVYTGIAPTATPNPNITWATINSQNIGLDFSMLNYHLSGTLDVYVNKMKNILGYRAITLPSTYGQSLAPENYAARSFRGTDISLTWNDKIGNDITYSVNGNLGYAKDRWDVLDQSANYLPGGPLAFESAIGQPANRIFGLKAIGIIRTQAELNALPAGFTQYGVKPYLGAILYQDVKGDGYKPGTDGKIDDNDIQLLSNNGIPRINFGFGFNVSWKGFSIAAHFQGVGAYDKMISNADGPGIRQWGGNFRTYYPIWAGDVWTPDNPNAKYPRVVGQNYEESGAVSSSFWLRNGAYVRLKNLNIGYNLPKRFINRIGLTGAQLFVNGTNLFTFSKVKEFEDPEQLNYDSYPVMKTLTVGMNIKF